MELCLIQTKVVAILIYPKKTKKKKNYYVFIKSDIDVIDYLIDSSANHSYWNSQQDFCLQNTDSLFTNHPVFFQFSFAGRVDTGPIANNSYWFWSVYILHFWLQLIIKLQIVELKSAFLISLIFWQLTFTICNFMINWGKQWRM